ncbi:MAG: F0F1 ATP synthase subunit alpha, partial [Acidiferrobacterales bacterium]
ASELDPATRRQIERGQRITEVMKQPQYAPMTVAQMAISLFVANEGYLDDIEVSKVSAFEDALQAYMKSSHAELMEKINRELDYTDEIESALKAAVENFKASHTW